MHYRPPGFHEGVLRVLMTDNEHPLPRFDKIYCRLAQGDLVDQMRTLTMMLRNGRLVDTEVIPCSVQVSF